MSEPVYPTITMGGILRNRRQDAKLSAAALADIMGESLATVFALESGRIAPRSDRAIDLFAAATKILNERASR